jgi:N6-adenosine-specific RNA methylase IME4
VSATKDYFKLPLNTYKTIYADPPWPEQGAGKIKRGADRHYPLMKVKDIAALPVSLLRDSVGCHLYLWVTNNYLEDGLSVMKAWGFEYTTTVTWGKGEIIGAVSEKGQPEYLKLRMDRAGLGQYYRGLTEHCLFGTYKALPYRKTASGKRAQGKTLILAPRTGHSRKPEMMRTHIEAVSHGPIPTGILGATRSESRDDAHQSTR